MEDQSGDQRRLEVVESAGCSRRAEPCRCRSLRDARVPKMLLSEAPLGSLQLQAAGREPEPPASAVHRRTGGGGRYMPETLDRMLWRRGGMVARRMLPPISGKLPRGAPSWRFSGQPIKLSVIEIVHMCARLVGDVGDVAGTSALRYVHVRQAPSVHARTRP